MHKFVVKHQWPTKKRKSAQLFFPCFYLFRVRAFLLTFADSRYFVNSKHCRSWRYGKGYPTFSNNFFIILIWRTFAPTPKMFSIASEKSSILNGISRLLSLKFFSKWKYNACLHVFPSEENSSSIASSKSSSKFNFLFNHECWDRVLSSFWPVKFVGCSRISDLWVFGSCLKVRFV